MAPISDLLLTNLANTFGTLAVVGIVVHQYLEINARREEERRRLGVHIRGYERLSASVHGTTAQVRQLHVKHRPYTGGRGYMNALSNLNDEVQRRFDLALRRERSRYNWAPLEERLTKVREEYGRIQPSESTWDNILSLPVPKTHVPAAVEFLKEHGRPPPEVFDSFQSVVFEKLDTGLDKLVREDTLVDVLKRAEAILQVHETYVAFAHIFAKHLSEYHPQSPPHPPPAAHPSRPPRQRSPRARSRSRSPTRRDRSRSPDRRDRTDHRRTRSPPPPPRSPHHDAHSLAKRQFMTSRIGRVYQMDHEEFSERARREAEAAMMGRSGW
ncbi:hypothetical protein JCM8097_004103 [Rhodosporidiobolus ruineniae]